MGEANQAQRRTATLALTKEARPGEHRAPRTRRNLEPRDTSWFWDENMTWKSSFSYFFNSLNTFLIGLAIILPIFV